MASLPEKYNVTKQLQDPEESEVKSALLADEQKKLSICFNHNC